MFGADAVSVRRADGRPAAASCATTPATPRPSIRPLVPQQASMPKALRNQRNHPRPHAPHPRYCRRASLEVPQPLSAAAAIAATMLVGIMSTRFQQRYSPNTTRVAAANQPL